MLTWNDFLEISKICTNRDIKKKPLIKLLEFFKNTFPEDEQIKAIKYIYERKYQIRSPGNFFKTIENIFGKEILYKLIRKYNLIDTNTIYLVIRFIVENKDLELFNIFTSVKNPIIFPPKRIIGISKLKQNIKNTFNDLILQKDKLPETFIPILIQTDFDWNKIKFKFIKTTATNSLFLYENVNFHTLPVQAIRNCETTIISDVLIKDISDNSNRMHRKRQTYLTLLSKCEKKKIKDSIISFLHIYTNDNAFHTFLSALSLETILYLIGNFETIYYALKNILNKYRNQIEQCKTDEQRRKLANLIILESQLKGA